MASAYGIRRPAAGGALRSITEYCKPCPRRMNVHVQPQLRIM